MLADLRAMFELCPEPYLQVAIHRPEKVPVAKGTAAKLPPGYPLQDQHVAQAVTLGASLGWKPVSIWCDGQFPWNTHVLFRSDPP